MLSRLRLPLTLPRRRRPARLRLETLEERTVPASLPVVNLLPNPTLVSSPVFWINPAGGDWDVAANWSTSLVPGLGTHRVPKADDVAFITTPGVTVTHNLQKADHVLAVFC